MRLTYLLLTTVLVAAVAHQEPADDATEAGALFEELGESKSTTAPVRSESSRLQDSHPVIKELQDLLRKKSGDLPRASLMNLLVKHQQNQVVGESVATGSTYVKTPMTANAIKQGGKIVAIMSARDNRICGMGGGQTFKCHHHNYLGYPIMDLGFEAGHFFIVEKHGDKVAFKTLGPMDDSKLYVSDRGGKLEGAASVGGWEKFDVVDSGGKIALKSGKTSKYCANEHAVIKCNRNTVGSWEKFIVIPIADNGDDNMYKESGLKSYLTVAFAAKAKSNAESKGTEIGMSYQWCQNNEGYGTKRGTGQANTGSIQWGSGGPTTPISIFSGIRYGVHRIVNEQGSAVLLCALWASVCGPKPDSQISQRRICGTHRIILGCKNPDNGWSSDCSSNSWEVPFA